MPKRKDKEKPVSTGNSPIIGGEAGRGDIGALVCDVLLLGMFLYNQFAYGLDMWFIILPLLIIGLYLVFFGVIPERYHFTASALEVRQIRYRVATIPYEEVFNLDVKRHDNFMNLLQANTVKVYYTVGKSKKAVVCKPKDVDAFVKELKARCPELQDEERKSDLDVFFDN